MKKITYPLIIIGILIVVFIAYSMLKSDNSTDNTISTTRSANQQNNSMQVNDDSTLDEPKQDTKTPITPEADVSTKFNLGTGNFEARTVNAKKGQQVKLGFEASFEDEVRIDEYGIKNIYVLPLSEQSIQFAADKGGEFRIYLVKRNKTIGTLIVK